MRPARRRNADPEVFARLAKQVAEAAELVREKGRSVSLEELKRSLRQGGLTSDMLLKLTLGAENIFESFIAAKLALEMPECLDARRNQKAPLGWLSGLLQLGDYEACLQLTELFNQQIQDDTVQGRLVRLRIFLSRAKAHRNLGHFRDALSSYRDALRIACELNRPAELAEILMLIGKIYGNYLGQQSLFHSFVEEAKNRLETAVESMPASAARTQCIRTLAICHDALGQAYRDSESGRAKHHFRVALRLNRRIKRSNGVCRATCHILYLEFQTAPKEKKEKLLSQYQHALEGLLEDENEERGLGIRWLHYASMLADLDRPDDALTCLRAGEAIAQRYSDNRTLTRTLMLKSRLISSYDSAQAIALLRRASELAKSYSLLLLESHIHLALAQIVANRNEYRGEIRTIFDQNRDIFLRLLKEVRTGLQRFSTNMLIDPEIQLLSEGTRRQFYQRLLFDFDHILAQLDGNTRALTTALQSSDARQQELLVFGIANSVAREVLHTIKGLIPPGGASSPLKTIASEITCTADAIRDLINAPGPLQHSDSLLEIDQQIRVQAGRVSRFAKMLDDLKTMLASELTSCRNLNERVRLTLCCKRAYHELAVQRPEVEAFISLAFECEVIVSSDAELMTSVIRNLLLNALEGAPGQETLYRSIELTVSTRCIGEAALGNPAREIVISVMTTFHDVNAAEIVASSLEGGLRGRRSEKPFSSGVGLELTRLVFEFLLGGKITVVRRGRKAGLEIRISPGTGKAEILPKEADDGLVLVGNAEVGKEPVGRIADDLR